jgi:parvulin-like peptidyl-prolyl isomerase
MRAKLVAGADFATLAKEVSDDPGAKQDSGELGWFAAATMDPDFAKAAFAMKNIGELSEPVHSSFGWHIIRFEGRREPRELPFDRVRKQIMLELKQRYVAEASQAKLYAIGHDPAMKVNQAAIDALLVKLPTQQSKPRSSPATN